MEGSLESVDVPRVFLTTEYPKSDANDLTDGLIWTRKQVSGEKANEGH